MIDERIHIINMDDARIHIINNQCLYLRFHSTKVIPYK